MRALVTGGCGFIGSHVVDELVAAGHDVRVVDVAEPRHGNQGAEYVHADLRDPASYSDALKGVDAVSHQASKVGLERSFADARDYVSHNDAGTAALLAALCAGGFGGRLVLASSMVVYGEGSYECPRHGAVRPLARRPEDLGVGRFEPPCPRCGADLAPRPVTEEAPIDPRNIYAATKVHQEHLCSAFARACGAELIALRYHNVYGPRMPRTSSYAGVASIFCSALASGQAPQVMEDGRQSRDFVHVADVARANLAALSAPDGIEGVFNIATGRPRSVLDLACALAAASGPDAPAPEVTGAHRLGDVRHIFASPERARRVLGWKAKVALEQGVAALLS
ncbi:MAG TPA: NAD-dependent epimerase/dehydratase family protein [Actinomycetota bacterium]|nr:NAD-dependent epimerase/dehydratase family protein [Actinomycetota bacterium]